MKQKNYTFERVNGSTDHVELHRKGRHFHFLARLLCLLLAVLFWLLVSALKAPEASDDGANDDRSDALLSAVCATQVEEL